MLGVGNADLERLVILGVVVIILLLVVLLVRTAFVGQRPAPQVPPVVSPQQHPFDEDVRQLKHWQANVNQKLPELETRVVRQGEKLDAIQGDLSEIRQTTENTQRMTQILVENGLRGTGARA